MAVNPDLRFLYVTWAFLECVLFGGIILGWGSLVYILIEEGVYSELCEGYSPPPSTTTQRSDLSVNHTTGHGVFVAGEEEGGGGGGNTCPNQSCPARDQRLALVFTIATVALCVGSATMGQLNYKYGTRLTRLCALVSFTFGALLTGFTSHDMPWLIFPGLSLLGIGGVPLLMTNTQFSMLFTRGSSTVVSLLCGAFDSSSGVTLILKLLYERGISLRWSMLVITCAHLMTIISTFFFLPEGFISKAVPDPVILEVEPTNSEEHSMDRKHSSDDDDEEEDSVQETDSLLKKVKEAEKPLPSILSCILSPLYTLHVLWMAILQLRFYFLIGSLNTWLTAMFSDKDDVSYYTNVCQYAMMFGLVSSFMAGIVYDINKRVFDDSRSQLRRNLMPAVIPQTLTAVLGIILSSLVLMDTPSILYPAFIVNVIFRSFVYSMAAAYIGVMFPSEYFGVLYGLMIVLSGAVGMAQYGLFAWSQSSGSTSVNIFLTVLLTVSLVHPLYQWVTCRRVEALACKLQSEADENLL